MHTRTLLTLSPVLAAGLLVSGLGLVACSSSPAEAQEHGHDHGDKVDHHESMWKDVTEAVAVIIPTEGNRARGVVRFTQAGENAVRVVADIENLQPNGTHGFHIHQYGDMTAADGTSLGGHYNPQGHEHAGPSDPTRHAGDLGNIKADAEGKAHLELTVQNVTIAGLKNPIIGRGLVVHAKADDLKSQPTGDAGGRIGVGVIGVANSKQ